MLVSSNLATGTATVTVNLNTQTIVTFTDVVNPTTGLIQVCKVAGSGVVLGTNFAFTVAGTPITVSAGPAPLGSCSTPVVVPAGSAIVTETLPAGTVLASVSTLPSAGLLVSSNLAAGTATVTVAAGGQTTVTFTDTVPPVILTGFLQICKIAGSGVAVGTNFTFNVVGTPVIPVTVAAGPAPLGSCSSPLTLPAGPAIITETLPIGTVLTSVSTLPSAGLLLSSNLAAGTATVTVNAGGQTIVTFLDTVPPVVPTTGFLQICKIAGTGIAVGTPITFTVAGTPVMVLAGAAPGGNCSTALVVTAGPVNIVETLPSGTALTSVSTLPAGLLVSSNLAAGTATVMVNAGGQTIATITNAVIPTTGLLQVCKTAGSGVAVGTVFAFNVAGTAVSVAAGSCSTPLAVLAGPASVTETLPAGTTLSTVVSAPAGSLVSTNLAAGSAVVTVTVGALTTATFTNVVIPTTGTLQVCKAAGSGVAVGTVFTFNVAGTVVTIPAGSCSTALVVTGGPATITETLPVGTTLSSVVTSPAGTLVSANLAGGSAIVTVNVGALTTANFTNVVIPTTGTVQVCKNAGNGVLVGTNFTFNVSGTMITVPAGSCSQALVFPIGTIITIAETPSVGTVVSAIGVVPVANQGVVNLNAGTVSVTVATGATTATFTNSAGGLGLLKVCKLAGVGVARGTNFTFVRAGTTYMVPAGFCASLGLVPVGTVVTITELFSPTTVVSAISVLPVDRQGVVDLAGRTVTATMGVGVTEVYFTNVAR